MLFKFVSITFDHYFEGASDANGAREEAAVPGDGLPEAVDRRVHARGAERAAAAAAGGADPLLRAGQDQQRDGELLREGRGRPAALPAHGLVQEAAAGGHPAVLPGRVGRREEGHQHAQVRAREHEGQVSGAAERYGRAAAAVRENDAGDEAREAVGGIRVEQRVEEAEQADKDGEPRGAGDGGRRRRPGPASRSRARGRASEEGAEEVEELYLLI